MENLENQVGEIIKSCISDAVKRKLIGSSNENSALDKIVEKSIESESDLIYGVVVNGIRRAFSPKLCFDIEVMIKDKITKIVASKVERAVEKLVENAISKNGMKENIQAAVETIVSKYKVVE